MDTENVDAIRKEVRDHYGQLSREGMGCCGTGGCCAADPGASAALGYTAEQLADAPEGANLGLGCGNPQAIARLTPGERVLDLGSGGGFDCFLAARQVGPTGHAIGVDMTPDMIERVPHAEIARRLAISVSGVKSRVQRGREQLRKMLTDCCQIALDARHAVVECVPKTGGASEDCCSPNEAPVRIRARTP